MKSNCFCHSRVNKKDSASDQVPTERRNDSPNPSPETSPNNGVNLPSVAHGGSSMQDVLMGGTGTGFRSAELRDNDIRDHSTAAYEKRMSRADEKVPASTGPSNGKHKPQCIH